MVMQGPPLRLLLGAGLFAGADVVPVHLGIVALVARAFVGRIEPGVEFLGAVQGLTSGGLGDFVPGGGLRSVMGRYGHVLRLVEYKYRNIWLIGVFVESGTF